MLACSTLKCIDFFLFACFLLRPLVFIWWRGRSRLHIDYKSVDFIVMGFYCGSLSSSSLSHRLFTMIIPPPFFIFFSLLMIHLNFFIFFCLGRKLGESLNLGDKKIPVSHVFQHFWSVKRRKGDWKGQEKEGVVAIKEVYLYRDTTRKGGGFLLDLCFLLSHVLFHAFLFCQ
jgi:hypothetical protein